MGNRCTELNSNLPRSSPESRAFVTEGDDEEEGMTQCERGKVRRLQSCGSGSKPTSLEHRYEKGIRTRMPSTTTTAASVLGTRGAVGTTGRGLGW